MGSPLAELLLSINVSCGKLDNCGNFHENFDLLGVLIEDLEEVVAAGRKFLREQPMLGNFHFQCIRKAPILVRELPVYITRLFGTTVVEDSSCWRKTRKSLAKFVMQMKDRKTLRPHAFAMVLLKNSFFFLKLFWTPVKFWLYFLPLISTKSIVIISFKIYCSDQKTLIRHPYKNYRNVTLEPFNGKNALQLFNQRFFCVVPRRCSFWNEFAQTFPINDLTLAAA